MNDCRNCGHCRNCAARSQAAAPYVDPTAEPLWESLPACQMSVFDGGRPTYESDCGEPAVTRVSWDFGATWLYLCGTCAEKVEMKVGS